MVRSWGVKMPRGVYKHKQHSEETKKKIGLSNFGKKRTPETKRRISEVLKGNTHTLGHILSEEHKKNISKSNIGKEVSIKTKQKISNALIGRKRLEETKQKISKSHIGKKHTKDTRQKMKLSHIGKRIGQNHSEETREKISKTLKFKFSKGIIKHSKGMLGKKQSKKFFEWRKQYIFPEKDTKIELKIQDFLTLLKIEFVTHKYMNIKHSYQCDILIPEQVGIPQKTIIECDGDYWHGNTNIKYFKELNEHQIKQKQKDDFRTKELLEKGYNVIRIWENKIKKMELNDFKEVLINSVKQ